MKDSQKITIGMPDKSQNEDGRQETVRGGEVIREMQKEMEAFFELLKDGSFAPQKTCEFISEYINKYEYHRIWYSTLSRKVFEYINGTSDFEGGNRGGTLRSNINSFLKYVCDNPENASNDVKEVIFKLCDHVSLAIVQCDLKTTDEYYKEKFEEFI